MTRSANSCALPILLLCWKKIVTWTNSAPKHIQEVPMPIQ